MELAHQKIRFEKALTAWPSDDFKEVVKQEIEQLDASLLPLQQGLSQGSYVTDEKFKVMIISVSAEKDSILVKAGIFYNSIIAGCNCSDDPTPVDSIPEYCVVRLVINKNTSETGIELLSE